MVGDALGLWVLWLLGRLRFFLAWIWVWLRLMKLRLCKLWLMSRVGRVLTWRLRRFMLVIVVILILFGVRVVLTRLLVVTCICRLVLSLRFLGLCLKGFI